MSYSYPLLGNRELIQCLGELGLDFNEEKLTKPEFEQVAKLFEGVVLAVMGVTRRAPWAAGGELYFVETSACLWQVFRNYLF